MKDFDKKHRDFIEEIRKSMNNDNAETDNMIDKSLYSEFDKLMEELFESAIELN